MVKKLVCWASAVVLFWAFGATGVKDVKAEETKLEMRPFLYEQGFEEKDPVKFWGSNAKYTVNFKGLTEEKAFSGKKSFKLDVTLHGDNNYYYWQIPVALTPAEGNLGLSAHILLGKETRGIIKLGVNLRYPTVPTSGAPRSPTKFRGPTTEWKLVEMDIGGGNDRNLMVKRYWGMEGKNIGSYVDKIGIYIVGGKRIVLYLDDIKLEGDIPTEASYKQEIKRRWAPYVQKFNELIASWEKAVREGENTVEPDSQKEKDLMRFKKEIAEIKKKGNLSPKKYDEMNFMLGRLKKTSFDI